MRSVSCPARPPALSVPAPAVACQRVGARERGRERGDLLLHWLPAALDSPRLFLVAGPSSHLLHQPASATCRPPSFLPLLSKRTHQSPTHPFSNGQRDGAVAPPFPQRWTETARGKWQAQFPPPSSSVATCRFATPALSLAPAVPALQMHHFQTHPF